MAESDAQAGWDEMMGPIPEDEEDPWMDDVYQMIRHPRFPVPIGRVYISDSK